MTHACTSGCYVLTFLPMTIVAHKTQSTINACKAQVATDAFYDGNRQYKDWKKTVGPGTVSAWAICSPRSIDAQG